MRFFIASGCPIATTTLYRCMHLAEQLGTLGHEADLAEWFDDAQVDPARVIGYDAIVLYRLPMSPPLSEVLRAAQKTETPVIFDTDDLIFEPELVHAQRGVARLSPHDQEVHVEGVRRYLQTLQACDAVMTATPFLAELAARRGKLAFVHRNALGQEMMALANSRQIERLTKAKGDRVVIGYGSGTPTHDVDFEEAASALCIVLDRFPAAELWVVGPLALCSKLEALDDRVRRFPLTDWRGWFERASQFDIALAPLELENVFCRAKSEIKFVEAAALSLPVVASKTEPYQGVISHGKDGLLAGSEQEWVEALSALIEAPQRRAQIGANARETILRRYSPQVRAAELAEILPRLLTSKSENAARV